MKPDIVADVGNSRVKWGRCVGGRVVETVSLLPDDLKGWQEQLDRWQLTPRKTWAVAGVHPERLERLVGWVRDRGDDVQVLGSGQQLPLEIHVEQPERVGLDRLLNAVAANSRRQPGAPAVIVDAGSAVTVDRVDRNGAFRGGVIFPGMRLMARALHEHTALLPIVEPPREPPTVPATSTVPAIEAGIFWAVLGGIVAVVREMTEHSGRRSTPQIFLTGGDMPLLNRTLQTRLIGQPHVQTWPEMTLEGIRLAAEHGRE